MSAEDRLRDLLRAEATTIQPVGDGLQKIQARLARKRRRRTWLVPSAALATAGAAAAFFLISPDDPRQTQTLNPAKPTATTSPAPTTAPTAVPADSYTGPAIWPFTSQDEANAWDSSAMPWADDGLEVGKHFVSDHLKLVDVTVTRECVSCEALQLKVGSTDVGTVALARYTVGTTKLFTVVNVGGTDLTITTPTAGQAITSPATASGRIVGLHENVNLRLISRAGTQLAQAGAPAGSEAPWSATLTWTETTWTHASLVGITGSDRDGSITRVVAVPVTRSTTSATASFIGLTDGHVSLYDATNGNRLRQLTFPAAGKTDGSAAWSAGTLAWARSSSTGCNHELNRLDGSTASSVAKSTTVRYGWVALSPSAAWLAWTEVPCAGGGSGEIVISGGGAPARRLPIPSGSVAYIHDVHDDGALLVTTNDRQATGPGVIAYVAPGALALEGLKPLQNDPECFLGSGAAFDDNVVLAFETCGEDIRLVHFTQSGARKQVDARLKDDPPNSISVRDAKILVARFGGDNYGAIARYNSGRFTDLIANSSCGPASELNGCVASPSW